MWPPWVVSPLLYGSFVGVIACLVLGIYGILHIINPEAERSRLYGVRFLGGGLICLIPLAVTLIWSDRLPIAF